MKNSGMQSTEYIWSSFHKELLGFIRHSVKDEETSKDVLQDVFLKIHLKRGTLKDDAKLLSWVWQITRNTVLDHFKSRKQFGELAEHIPSPARDQSFNIYFAQCMEPFIQNLSTQHREAILRIDIEGMSQKEFAQKSGLSYSAAKSRVQRARQQLKELFLQCCAIPADRYGNILDMIPKKNCCHQRLYEQQIVSSM